MGQHWITSEKKKKNIRMENQIIIMKLYCPKSSGKSIDLISGFHTAFPLQAGADMGAHQTPKK